MTEAQYTSLCVSDTEKLGGAIAAYLKKGGKRRAFIALRGEMGVGKTAFTRGFAAALNCPAAVKSPTYAIVHEYPTAYLPIFHFDVCRVTDEDDLTSVGYWDYLDREGFVVCEWSENITDCIPEDALYVTISRVAADENARLITVNLPREEIAL